MKDFVYVDIMVNQAKSALHCTGITRNLEQRLLEHNPGNSRHSAQHRRWRIETVVAFKSESKAHNYQVSYEGDDGNDLTLTAQ